MKNLLLFITFIFYSFLAISQITNFTEKFDLPVETKETSGLLFFDSKLITHNDSGNQPNLYEIDSLTGNLLRVVHVNNATNIDWEDITEDENHIYIADIGNNNGNRTDLKIYKILKSDFKNSASISADIISFSYEDQTNFDSKPNGSNFDAESIVVYNNSILIFTKNWNDLKTNVYKTPLITGNYYISREHFTTTINGNQYDFTQKLYEFQDATSPLLSLDESKLAKIIISPIPATNKIKINTSLPFLNLEIYNSLGKKMDIPLTDTLKELDISNLEKGVYILKIQSNNNKSVVRKIIKL